MRGAQGWPGADHAVGNYGHNWIGTTRAKCRKFVGKARLMDLVVPTKSISLDWMIVIVQGGAHGLFTAASQRLRTGRDCAD